MLIKQPEDDVHTGTGLPSKCKSINISYWLRCLTVICLHELKQTQCFDQRDFSQGGINFSKSCTVHGWWGVDVYPRAAGNGSMPLKKDLSLKIVTFLGSGLNQHCPAPVITGFHHFLNKKDVSACCFDTQGSDSCKQRYSPFLPQVL